MMTMKAAPAAAVPVVRLATVVMVLMLTTRKRPNCRTGLSLILDPIAAPSTHLS
jgi:hypothetical protein